LDEHSADANTDSHANADAISDSDSVTFATGSAGQFAVADVRIPDHHAEAVRHGQSRRAIRSIY
jgi:hypothetical protein